MIVMFELKGILCVCMCVYVCVGFQESSLLIICARTAEDYDDDDKRMTTTVVESVSSSSSSSSSFFSFPMSSVSFAAKAVSSTIGSTS